VNENNYIRCEIDDDGFQAVRILAGKESETLIGTKTVPSPKSDWYRIRISAGPDRAALDLQEGDQWDRLGELPERGFAETQFGFYVPRGQGLQLADFDGRPFR
jgi:hypothetical protein